MPRKTRRTRRDRIESPFDVGHGGTDHLPHGGEFTRVTMAWLNGQLKGEQLASSMFLGADSELSRDPKWTIEVKKFPPVQ